jgi:hypothetical protein
MRRPVGAVAVAPLVLVASLLVVTGCAPNAGGQVATFPATTTAPDRPVSAAVGQTRAAIAAALGQRDLTLSDTQAPYRPAEAPMLASAPRAVYQAWLPQDPDKGLIVVYEFADAQLAAAAAAEQQSYLATGPGRVQSPQGTVHVIRGLGTTVIVYDWLPGAGKDPTAPEIQSGLETLGIPYPVG